VANPEEWHHRAINTEFAEARKQLAGHIPASPIDLPEASLIELDEHHVAPLKSKENVISKEQGHG